VAPKSVAAFAVPKWPAHRRPSLPTPTALGSGLAEMQGGGFKKSLRGAEQDRPDVALARDPRGAARRTSKAPRLWLGLPHSFW
jgi:hypothetical protein